MLTLTLIVVAVLACEGKSDAILTACGLRDRRTGSEVE